MKRKLKEKKRRNEKIRFYRKNTTQHTTMKIMRKNKKIENWKREKY